MQDDGLAVELIEGVVFDCHQVLADDGGEGHEEDGECRDLGCGRFSFGLMSV